jgi:hypothetical protein
MATFKFSYSEPEYCNGDSDVDVKVEYSISGEMSLATLLEHFEEFLKGTGYSATLTGAMIDLVPRR